MGKHKRIDHESLPDGLDKLRVNVEITAMEESWEAYELNWTREVLNTGESLLRNNTKPDEA